MRCIRTVKALRAREGIGPRGRRALHRRRSRRALRAPRRPRAALSRRRRARSRPTSTTTASSQALRAARRRRGLAGLGLRRRGSRLRRALQRRGHPLPRPAAGGDAHARRQDRREAARRDGGCPGAAVERRRGRGRRARAARGRGDRLPAAREGDGGRRRPRHPHRRTARASSPGRSARRAPRRSPPSATARVFLEAAVRGGRHVEVQIVADEHGTRARPRLPRLLGPAPPPEGDRGGAAAGALARLPRGASRRTRGASPRAVGYGGVGTVEFLVAGERLLLPRGEPAPPGRARHHRGDHRPRPRRAPDPHRARRAARGARRRERGVAIEARVCAEDPDAGFLPDARAHRALRPGARPARARRHRRRRPEPSSRRPSTR